MAVKNVLRMNPGDGETSYANNSGLQKVVISEALPVLEKTLKEMFGGGGGGGGADGFSKSLKMVDMGCSSGPNAIFVISHILDTIEDLYRKNDIDKSLVVEVFLNDLPDNDFNNLFKLLPSLSDQLNDKETRQCFLYGLPGSFYGRLFPSGSLHFAYSSYSLHWLSQVPEGLKKNNKENIYMARTSPPEVFEAYAKQYQRDFFTFLSSRGDEIIPGGRMVLTFIGRSVEDPSREDDCAHLRLLSETLLDMVAEGLVKIDDLYSFNVPMYMPYYQEVERVIQDEGSFNLDKLQNFRVRWDAHDDNVVDEKGGVFRDKYTSGKLVADCVRAFMEPMLATHFGSSIVDQVFGRYAEKVAAHLSTEEGSYFTILISLRRI